MESSSDWLNAMRSEALAVIHLTRRADLDVLTFSASSNRTGYDLLVRIANTADGGVRICVQDDGVGFTPDVREGALGLTMMRSFSGLRYFKWVAECRFCHDRQLS